MRKKSPETGTGKTSGKRLLGYAVKAALILAAVAILAGIAKMPSQKSQAPATEAPPVNVTVQTVVAEPELADTFELPAVIEPNRVVTVAAEVAGRIERIGPKKGDVVRAGDLLIQLNADLLRPQFDSAKAQLDFDQIEYKRMANLVEENATAKRDLDNATAQLAISKARVEEILARLDRTAILAPIGGVLDDLLVEQGEYVDPGNPVAQLVENDPVKVVVEVPERDTAFFAPGGKAEVLIETKGIEKSLVGQIEFISELADSQTRSTRMEILLTNQERLLRSGQIVRVRLCRRVLKEAILIPLLAVIPMEDSMAVYVVSSAQAERREVRLGIIKGDRVQVLSGLKADDQLIVAGHRFVAPGQKVNIVSKSSTPGDGSRK
ncbi:MAG TPA: efflux RND transporter periplasmic adaptor subunit [Sedimentisphaerales bacterium]|nr:efflux RND transporter periplasmic adaptor subunit [Sedimentisphaerales bacterium]